MHSSSQAHVATFKSESFGEMKFFIPANEEVPANSRTTKVTKFVEEKNDNGITKKTHVSKQFCSDVAKRLKAAKAANDVDGMLRLLKELQAMQKK